MQYSDKKKTETPEKCSGEFEQHDNETSHLFFFFFKEKESYTNSLLNRLNVSDIFRTEYVSGNVPCLPMIVWEEDNERLHDL